jgi:hypothetical protein
MMELQGIACQSDSISSGKLQNIYILSASLSEMFHKRIQVVKFCEFKRNVCAYLLLMIITTDCTLYIKFVFHSFCQLTFPKYIVKW